jgi:eukaryotic-like serine/threonine-protein kinase
MAAMGATDTIDLRHRIKRCPDCGQRYSSDSAFCPFDGQKLEGGSWEAPADPLLGKTIDGRYKVTAVLGEGGMGTVYEVKHAKLDRTFALKALRLDLAREQDLAERFIREAKATGAIKHPNVVAITDFGSLPDGRPYFVMEKLSGQTLGEVVKMGGAIPAARAAAIAIKVARALCAAHEAGIIHRDLKPDNVFLLGRADAGPDQDVRVVDFGAAMIAGKSRLTKAGIVFGTPYYMSPEQASGDPVDHRADVYALGVIMYEMFTGRVPFQGDTYMGVLTQHMFAQPTPPSRLKPELGRDLGALEAITLKCLEKQPSLRFASMEELAKEVERVVSIDGTVTLYLDGGEARGEPRIFAMADALELPSASEIRDQLAQVREENARDVRARRGALLLPLAVGAIALLVAVFAWRVYGSGSPPPPAPAPAPLVSMAVAPPSAVPRSVALSANVPADVFLGAALVGRTPLALRVDDGASLTTYTLKADGYVDQDVVVGAAGTPTLDVALKRRPAPLPARPAATRAASVPTSSDLKDPWK